jgi:hypothetical protein
MHQSINKINFLLIVILGYQINISGQSKFLIKNIEITIDENAERDLIKYFDSVTFHLKLKKLGEFKSVLAMNLDSFSPKQKKNFEFSIMQDFWFAESKSPTTEIVNINSYITVGFPPQPIDELFDYFYNQSQFWSIMDSNYNRKSNFFDNTKINYFKLKKELENCKINESTYDITDLLLRYKVCFPEFWREQHQQFRVLLFYKIKKDILYSNFLFFNNSNSKLLKLLIENHGFFQTVF